MFTFPTTRISRVNGAGVGDDDAEDARGIAVDGNGGGVHGLGVAMDKERDEEDGFVMTGSAD